MMDNIFMIDKSLMSTIIATLKTLDIRGFESMDKLVGVVMLLEQAMNPPEPETTTETINLEDKETAADG